MKFWGSFRRIFWSTHIVVSSLDFSEVLVAKLKFHFFFFICKFVNKVGTLKKKKPPPKTTTWNNVATNEQRTVLCMFKSYLYSKLKLSPATSEI